MEHHKSGNSTRLTFSRSYLTELRTVTQCTLSPPHISVSAAPYYISPLIMQGKNARKTKLTLHREEGNGGEFVTLSMQGTSIHQPRKTLPQTERTGAKNRMRAENAASVVGPLFIDGARGGPQNDLSCRERFGSGCCSTHLCWGY